MNDNSISRGRDTPHHPRLREGQKLFDDDDDAAGFIPRNCRHRSCILRDALFRPKDPPFVPISENGADIHILGYRVSRTAERSMIEFKLR